MDKKDLYDLMKINSEKMNFQQNMCFQLQNWALVFTIGLISVSWTIHNKVCHQLIGVLLHGFLVLILIHLLFRNRKWMVYFILFRERTVMLEKMIFKNKIKSNLSLKYFKYHFFNSNKVCVDAIEDEFRVELLRSCIYYIFLICLSVTSLILLAYYEY